MMNCLDRLGLNIYHVDSRLGSSYISNLLGNVGAYSQSPDRLRRASRGLLNDKRSLRGWIQRSH